MRIKKITKKQYQITDRGMKQTVPSRDLAINYVSFINKERGQQKWFRKKYI